MTTQEYLNQLRNIDFEIIAIGSETQSLWDIATNMHVSYDDIHVDKSPNPGRMEDIIIQIVDREQKADRKRGRLMKLKLHIEDQIKKMDDRLLYALLWWTYHDGCRIHEMSKRIKYTEKHTRRLIRRAENEFEKKYGEEYLGKKCP